MSSDLDFTAVTLRDSYDICIVGGGPAGMAASIVAAKKGADVVLLDKKAKVGLKLAITGKGRCNFTNDTDVDQVILNTPGNGTFLYSSLYRFGPLQLRHFFNEIGVESKVERGGRVFPVNDSAKSVVKALVDEMKRLDVHIKTGFRVRSIEALEEGFNITGINQPDIKCGRAIVATGGITYPLTGSTGDGYEILTKLGHTLVEPRCSLVPLESNNKWIKDLAGLSLRNINATLYIDDNIAGSEFGEMLFTHTGVSGPVVLTLSRLAVQALDNKKDVKLVIDLKPALDQEQLDKRLLRDFEKHSKKTFKNSLDDLLPRLIIPVVVKETKINALKQSSQLTRDERQEISHVLKHFEVPITGYGSLNEAVVTQGGIDVSEVNPKTMESKLVKNLFICGELLDVDAYTGGYNLTAAFSTGYTAGYSAAVS